MHPTVLDSVYMKKVVEIAAGHEMDSFEICGACGNFTEGSLDGLLYFEEYPLGAAAQNKEVVRHNRESLNAIVRMAHGIGKPVYYWHREVLCNEGLRKSIPALLNKEGEFDLLGDAYESFLRYKIRKFFEAVPEIDGLVLTLTEASASTIHNSQPELYPPEKVVEKLSRIFAEELSARGKKLIVRSFGSIENDYNSIDAGVRLLSKDHSFEIETKVTPYDFTPFMPDNKFLHKIPGCTISAECDALGEYLGAGRMPSECIEDIVRYVRFSQKIGVDRITIRLDRHGKNVFDSYPINLYAYEQAIANPDITADEIRRSYYNSICSNKKDAAELIRMSEDGRDCAYKSLFINGSLIYHQFPTKPTLQYLKAGGIFALFSKSGDLSRKKEQWGIALDKGGLSRNEIILEKEKAVSIARENLSRLAKLKKKIPAVEYDRLLSLWTYAEAEAAGNCELCKAIAAYFDSMEADDPKATALVSAIGSMRAALDRKQLNRPVVEIAKLLLEDYHIEYAMRHQFAGCEDIVIPAGIFDDVRGERYMHGAFPEYENGSIYLKIGNPIFPNAFYKTELKGGKEGVDICLIGKGMAHVIINGKPVDLDLSTAPSVRMSAADKYVVRVSKVEGYDYPSLGAVYKSDCLYTGLPFRMEKIGRPQIASRRVSIIDFGARPDGRTLNTQCFRDAIEALYNTGGGHLDVPAGLWLTGPITLKSGIDLHLERGAVILFSDNPDHYEVKDMNFEGRDTRRCQSQIEAFGQKNICITGEGIIEGNGENWRALNKIICPPYIWDRLTKKEGGVFSEDGTRFYPSEGYKRALANASFNIPNTPMDETFIKHFLRPVMIGFQDCENILLEGVTFQNSPSWNLHPVFCKNVIVNDITVRSYVYGQNGDGIDIDACENVLVLNSAFDVGDDAICVKSGKNEDGRRHGKPTRNLIVDGCTAFHGHGGFVVGSEMSGGVENVMVRNCTFVGTEIGLRFKSCRGRGGVVSGIWIENINMDAILTDAIVFDLLYAQPSFVRREDGTIESPKGLETRPVDETTPAFRNISIKNVCCSGAEGAMNMIGLPEMPISGISLENCEITSKYGILMRFCEDIRMKSVKVHNSLGLECDM